MLKGRILFLYANKEGHPGIPNGLALLSSCVREDGFDTKCFDTTFFSASPETLLNREKHGGIMKVNYNDHWGDRKECTKEEISQLFIDCIKEYEPNVICSTLTDVNYSFAKFLLKEVKQKFDIPIIVGGITATLDPEMVINDFNILCVGEGEDALVEFCNCIRDKKDFGNIKNLWIKKLDGTIIKNSLRSFKNLDSLPNQDWSIFDKRHYYKPYCGSFYRTLFVELSRGCHFNCTFCCTSKLRNTYKDLGKYVRMRNIEQTINEIKFLKGLYNIELIFFIDDNYLGMPIDRLKNFCKEYKEKIGLPYYIQTRPETITEEKILILKDSGISTIAIGLEHGDEEYRKKYLNRKMKNDIIENAFEIIHKYDIRSTANIILGMPFETEQMMKETIKLMQKIKPKSYSINYWTPYVGTKMRDMAIEQKIISKDYIVEDSNDCLNIPNFGKDKIKYYYENFSKYISGELNYD